MLKQFIGWNQKASNWLERTFPGTFSSPSYEEELRSRIARDIEQFHASVILEVGGIDRPLLKRCLEYIYIGLDIEVRPECVRVYDRFLVQSIETQVNMKADMVISITLLEHVPDNNAAIRCIFNVLEPGGVTHHYVPSKWHPYAIALRMVGSTWQKRLISMLRPTAIGEAGYPAHFNYCSPSEMIRLFHRHGFTDINMRIFYRANDYFRFFFPAYIIISIFENICSLLGWRVFASGFVISACRPSTKLPIAKTC
jgi:hypothetical protein